MKALTDERWQEIRNYETGSADSLEQIEALFADALQQHDHLAAQIKLLADYIMSERPDDPAWSLGEGACSMAVEIMKREAHTISVMKGDEYHKKVNPTCETCQNTRRILGGSLLETVPCPDCMGME